MRESKFDLGTLLQNSGLIHGMQAASLMVEPMRDMTSAIPAKQVLDTYSIRLQVLHEQTGSYVTSLLDSMSEMVGHLRGFSGDCSFIAIEAEHPYSFIVLVSSDGDRALGCMKVRPSEEWLADHGQESLV